MAGMSLTSDAERPIYLTYLNGTGYCFNVNDYMKIRSDYRVVGSFVGTCSTRGWSPETNGLPAEFNIYETRLLIEKGFARLISKDSLATPPTVDEKHLYQQILEERIAEQENHLKEGKLNESTKCIEKIMAGKREKLMKSGVNEKDINLTPEDLLNEIASNITFDRQNALLDIPYEHPFKYEGSVVEVTSDASEQLKYQVFLDLWDRGMYVTSGEAFGADFLAYPGDPLVFHASHIVIALADATSVPTMKLIAKGRLAIIVKKICMFAYYSRVSSDCRLADRNDKIAYQVLHWEGCKENIRKLQAVVGRNEKTTT